jgi:nucleoid-associated protein YgaU
MTGGLVKAFIALKDGSQQLKCMFNPREYTITKSGKWHKTPAKGAKSAPKPEFVGAEPRSMNMELFFDAWESSGDISKDIDLLLEWTSPTKKSISDNKPNPPIVVFHWGSKSYFDAYVKQVTAKYTMFKPDGTPVRATVTVGFEEVPAEPPGTNPTSGGVAGKRTHLVGEADTLHSVAYTEYGEAALWRGLADLNGIDDPLRLTPGTTLLIPTATAARERS